MKSPTKVLENQSQTGMAILDGHGEVVGMNRIFRALSYSGDGDDPLSRLLSPADLAELKTAISEAREGKEFASRRVSLPKKGSRENPGVVFAVSLQGDGKNTGYMLLLLQPETAASDIQHLRLLKEVAVAANIVGTLEEAFQVTLNEVCALTGWPVGHVFVPDPGDSEVLISSGIWRVEDPERYQSFRDRTGVSRYKSGVGLPGRVVQKRSAVWMAAREQKTKGPRAEVADQVGIHWGIGFPVFAGGEVAAVIEFFSDELLQPEADLLDAMSHVGRQLGIVVERQRSEARLRRATEDYRGLFENAHDAIIVFRPEDENVLEVNNRACEVYGYGREEFVGMSLKDISRDKRKGETRVMETLEKKSTLQFETVQFRKDGSEMHLEVNASVIDYRGEQCILSINRDITSRKRLEEQFLQAQKMEAIGRLAAGVAHDFNNQLSAILGFAQLALRQVSEDQPIHGHLQQILRASGKSADLTRQLLAFGRRQVARPKILDLNKQISDMRLMLERVIGEDVQLITNLDNEAGCVRLDPAQLEQVILNLVVNARDAMPGGGKLSIETLPPKNGMAVFSVVDSGTGMDEEMVKKIFDPFYTTKEEGRGTGLGLATVHAILDQNGGEITVESRPARGTRFSMFLPVAVMKKGSRRKAVMGRKDERAVGKILLVEDNEIVRLMALESLESKGYTVYPARTGEEAIREFAGRIQEIDILVTDVVMPGMNGRELTEELRKKRKDLRVLYISGYTDDNRFREQILKGNEPFLPKPFLPDDLTGMVDRLLS